MRKVQFVNREYYHIFNRGVDKRNIFIDQKDLDRFFQSATEFNVIDPIGSLYSNSFRKNNPLLKDLVSKKEKLVDFICYCLNPNHYHFVLKQIVDRGIEKFMHRLGSGYTTYFDKKYDRSGSLFQGTFKAAYIDSNEYLLYVSAYVNLNNKVHQIEDGIFKTSWAEYTKEGCNNNFCDKSIILNQFPDSMKYREFAENIIATARERKELEKLLKLDDIRLT